MRTYLLIFFCVFSAASVHAQQTCNSNMPASTPDSQLTDNGNGTVTDSKTGLMWKQCVEGQTFSGGTCSGTALTFTWKDLLQRPGTVNGDGFAGHADWRLPNIKELLSIVEEQCYSPAINVTRFPNTPSYGPIVEVQPIPYVWSGSPYAYYSGYAWVVNFDYGNSDFLNRNDNDYNLAVRLVRGGQ